MKRLLLLLPTRGYRAEPFVLAAESLVIDLTVASEEPSSLEHANPAGLVTLAFSNPEKMAIQAAEFHRRFPVDAVVGVDDATAAPQAIIAEALGLPSNPAPAVIGARDKWQMRQALERAGIPGPRYRCLNSQEAPNPMPPGFRWPVVVKPLSLSGSRGVIRADNPDELETTVEHVRAIARIVAAENSTTSGPDASSPRPVDLVLVEEFVPGVEVALEGLLSGGRLATLALFDKPDPLNGPFFEETIYTTPSRLSASDQSAVSAAVARAAEALGLRLGPIHAEIRMSPDGPVVIELNPRSIGGRCSRMLRFGAGLTLEEIILRQALDMEIPTLEREASAVGVMMIPCPWPGILRRIEGEAAAASVPGIVELSINVRPGDRLVPLPEESLYTGFIFARADSAPQVETALRESHSRLKFVVDPNG
jgi:biotin carboxylase